MGSIPRLYVDQTLAEGQAVALDRDKAHYLFSVMRRRAGDAVLLFDGRTGEWAAEVAEAGRRDGRLLCRSRTRPLRPPPDLWLLFAPIKKARTDFIVEKAAELGVARLQPVATELTQSERVRRDRLQAHAVEAAEQCGGTHVPEVAEMTPLGDLLATWDPARHLIFCDETRAEPAAAASASREGEAAGPEARSMPGPPAAILIGPEGGFAPAERDRLRALSFATPIGLGPRILRADTASVAALTLWQSRCGDW